MSMHSFVRNGYGGLYGGTQERSVFLLRLACLGTTLVFSGELSMYCVVLIPSLACKIDKSLTIIKKICSVHQ